MGTSPSTTETVKVTKPIQRIVDAVASKDISKSEGIRRLAALDLKAGPIGKLLGIRYQFARNVLVRQENVATARAARAATAEVATPEPETPETPESDEDVEADEAETAESES